MNKRSPLLLVMAGVLLLAFVGCGKAKSQTTAESAPTPKSTASVSSDRGNLPDDPVTVKGENGLLYQLMEGGTQYMVVGMGDCKDAQPTIAETVNGLPVVAIGESAFADCTQLDALILPESVTMIGGHAFEGCTNLESIALGQSVTNIDRYAFKGCSALTSFSMPHSVLSLGTEAFAGCTNLVSIAFSEKIPEISKGAFADCNSLITLMIPSGTTYIAPSAFQNCTGLAGLTIPVGVTEIGENAFAGCKNLKKVVFESAHGWSVTVPDSEEAVVADVSDPQLNVTLLTAAYVEGKWVRE